MIYDINNIYQLSENASPNLSYFAMNRRGAHQGQGQRRAHGPAFSAQSGSTAGSPCTARSGRGTVHAKARAIEKALATQPFDPRWMLRSLVEKSRRCGWRRNGPSVDLRDMPREVQEIAFEDGLIPYIPADRKVVQGAALGRDRALNLKE